MTAALLLAAIFTISTLGCWFGAPPDQRRQIVNGFARDLRRERAIRQ